MPNSHRRPTVTWRQLVWPQPLDGELALGALRRFAAEQSRGPIIFETRCANGEISHLVRADAGDSSALGTFETLIPGLGSIEVEETREPLYQAVRMRIGQGAMPLEVSRAKEAARAILSALSSATADGEEVVVQIVLGKGFSPQTTSATLDPTQGLASRLVQGNRPPSAEVARRLRSKDSELGFRALVRVGATARSDSHRRALIRAALGAFRTLETPGVRLNFLDTSGDLDQLPKTGWLRLSATEILALIGWPVGLIDAPGMPQAHPRMLRLTGDDVETQRVFATTAAQGPKRPIGLSVEDGLFGTVVNGPTGAGKSTLLLNLAVRDMEAGRSLAVIDMKRDLVMDILARVPAHRRDDVVVLDPTAIGPVVGLNPLSPSLNVSPELAADGLLGVIEGLFPQTAGPRWTDALHAALLTIARHDGATLTWLPKILTDAEFRGRLVAEIDEPELQDFWVEFEALGQRQQLQVVGPITSRLRQLLLRPAVRRVLDQAEPRFSLTDLFDRPRIFLLPLNSGMLTNGSARLLGSLVVSTLWSLTLRRAGQLREARRPVTVMIDEAQEFLNTGMDIGNALGMSRGLGVGWIISHQARFQMPAPILSALDNNARNRVSFVHSAEDARAVAAMDPELEPADLMALKPYEIYTSLLRHGRPLGWVSGKTLPPPPVTSEPDELIAQSQQRYGRAEAPRTSRQNPPTDGPIGQKRRQL